VNQSETVPVEVKGVPEAHLFQQYCSYIEPINYTDLLMNIMKSIRARWNYVNNSNKSTPMHLNEEHESNLSAIDGDYSYNSPRHAINIQYKRYIFNMYFLRFFLLLKIDHYKLEYKYKISFK